MISKEEVKHIAELARLGLTDKEVSRYQKELSVILDHFEKIKKVKIGKEKPLNLGVSIENRVRKDVAKEGSESQIKKLLEQAPEVKNGYLKTKSILK
jgi:aspartyl-tRNA(Asn)/glutamyl-tRNA(Gln) amidotransferase subunit C